MGHIRVLDDALVDQIAAGEVVERPASVVKELVENAIDAGARNLTIEIARGGVALVRVTDDGEAMDREDAVLALERHATSKIRVVTDLERIATLGFRGEALASIASVSRLTLTTRRRDASVATRVSVEGGAKREVRDAGAAPGTSVAVEELFYNVPARRKFLKAQATESAHVADTCLRAALGHPELRVVLVRDGKRAREWLPTASVIERAITAFADDSLAPLEGERGGIHLCAALGAPEHARTGALGLHLFVNGRPVRDRALARAVAFAYGSVLQPGRYPSGVVHIVLDAGDVDVNVHPQKSEVRFARAAEVLDAVTRILASRLGTIAWGGLAPRGRAGFWDERLAVGPSTGSTPEPPSVPYDITPDPWGLAGVAELVAATVPSSGGSSAAARLAEPSRQVGTAAVGVFARLRPLAQVQRVFIVCEDEEGLHVIDQHAADERVRFQRFRASYEARAVKTQRLLFPERVELSEREVALLESERDAVLAVGLDVGAIGPTTVAVHAIPSLLARAAPARLVRDLVDELERAGGRAFGDAIDMALATMACHAAIRAGDHLTLDECGALLRSLDEVDDFAGHCPHGRPIVFSIPFAELERRLGR